MTRIEQRTFKSYSSLDSAHTDVVHPASLAALQQALQEAARQRSPVAFRAAGGSFHDQALSAGTLITLDRMPRLATVSAETLSATSTATIGEANRLALAAGCVLPTAPSSERITLGGTFAANCVSRFCGLVGKAADAVESFTLLTPDGERHTVRRPGPGTSALNDALFRAVPGSFGELGFVSDLHLRLLTLPAGIAGHQPRIETAIVPTTDFDQLIDTLTRDQLQSGAPPQTRGTLNLGRTVADGVGTWALSNQEGRAVVFRSRYVPGDRPLKPFFLHQPDGPAHQLGEFASVFRLWSRLGWNATWQVMKQRSTTYVDGFDGFTYMMDGNWRARENLERVGLTPWLLQQSYLLPIRRDALDPGAAAKAFLESARRDLNDAGIRIDCIDLLLLPADDGLLSASRGREGILLSLACQGLSRATAVQYEHVLTKLSRRCAELGGRVHLLKNVFAEPDVLQEMYGEAFSQFRELKEQLDPAGALRNPFLSRLSRSARQAQRPQVTELHPPKSVPAPESRPISGVERVMLRLGSSMGADLVIGRVEGSIDAEAFHAAALAVVQRHPTLRLEVQGQPPERFVFTPPERAVVDVEVLEAGGARGAPAWQQAALEQTRKPFALAGEAACRFVLVRGQPGRESHVIIAAPHALVDGRCLMRLLHDLLFTLQETSQGLPPSLPTLPVTPAAATLIRFPKALQAAAPVLRRVWARELHSHHTRPPLRPRRPAHRESDIATLATFREGTRAGWERLQQACRRHDVTVGGALMAATWFACARLVHDERGTPPLKLMMDIDVDMRSRLDQPVPDTHVGYYTGFAPIGGRVAPETDFWKLAARLRRETTRVIDWSLPTVVHLLPETVPDYFEFARQHGVDPLGGGGSGSLAAISNVGKYPYGSTYGALRLTGLWGLNGACALGPALISWLRFLDGHLFFNAIGGAPAIDQAQLERFQDAIFSLLEHPVEHLTVAEFCSRRTEVAPSEPMRLAAAS